MALSILFTINQNNIHLNVLKGNQLNIFAKINNANSNLLLFVIKFLANAIKFIKIASQKIYQDLRTKLKIKNKNHLNSKKIFWRLF